MKENKALQHRNNAVQHQPDGIEISTDGRNHRVKASGNTAKGVAVAASAIVGFAVGFLLARR